MRYAIAAAALSLALVAPVHAQQVADTTPDVRCMVVMMNLSQSPEQRRQMEALIGSFYFLGRIDAQDPKLELEKHITSEMDTMTDAQFATEVQRCEGAMSAKMKVLSDMADDLDKKAQQAAPSQDAPKDAPPVK